MRIFYGWYIVIAASIATCLCFGLAYYNNPVFYPAYINEFQWSRTVVVSGSSLNFIVFGIMSPFIGMLADKFSVKKIVLAGILCDALSKIGFSFMTTLPHYYLSNVLVGIGIACTSMLPLKLLIARWFKRREGTAIGIVVASTAVGGGIGPVLTSYFLSQYGWREVQLVLSVLICVLVVPIFWWLVRDRPEDLGLSLDGDNLQHPTPDGDQVPSLEKANVAADLTFREALTTPTFWMICSAILLFHVCVISISQHFVLHLSDLGLNLSSASAGLSVILSASVIGRFGFGALSDMFSKKRLLIAAYLLLSVMSFMLFLIGTPWLSNLAKSTAAIYIIAALIGVGYGGGIVGIPIVVGKCFGLSSLGKIFGLIMLFNAVGGTIGPILSGYLFDITGSYQLSFFIISVAAFAAVGCLTFIKTDVRKFDYDAALPRRPTKLMTER